MATETKTMLKLKFKWQNDTKGAVRYGEILPSGRVAIAPNDPGACIGTLYIRKTAFDTQNFPNELSVIIEG